MPRASSALVAVAATLLTTFSMPASANTGASATDSTVTFSAAETQAIEKQWSDFRADNGDSHASGFRPEFGKYQVGNPTTHVTVMRIGLRYSYRPDGVRSEFYGFDHPKVQVTGTVGTFHVVDLATGTKLFSGDPGQAITVAYSNGKYDVTLPDSTVKQVTGPVRLKKTDTANTFKVLSIERINTGGDRQFVNPDYRGELEVSRGPSTAEGMVNLVNEIDLENYVRGIIINESPASFHVEALKSQAVAARGYGVANIGRFREQYPFDLDDSVLSQVYRGRVAEHVNGNTATDGTTGLVASYNGKIISAYYSSSMAGHPDNVEWSFYDTGDQAKAVPYLVGRYDGPAGTEPDLSTEAGLRAFWANDQPQVYDSRLNTNNSRNRWAFVLTKAQLEANIEARKATAKVISGSATAIGSVSKCEGTKRSPTGRIVIVRCTGSEAVWDFENWDNVRRVFPSPTLGVLNNPVFLDHTYATDGTLVSVNVIGGGWGHNVGMSQYGAHGRGKAGQTFGEIITFYYKDTTIGSYPIDLKVGSPRTVRQEFATIDGSGKLQIRNPKNLWGMTVTVNNDYCIRLSARDLAKPLVEIDLTGHLVTGKNVIQYTPQGYGGTATALVKVYPK